VASTAKQCNCNGKWLWLCFELQLCDGASPEERQRWFLRPAQEFHYLNQSTCYDIPGDSNAEEYKVRQTVHL